MIGINYNPKVSVVMITYGHEKYIKMAIDGVLSQKCDFEYELILSNDASKDNSDSIIQEILSTHPLAHRIVYTKHEKNIGMMPNSLYSFSKCRGEYIAWCEGDDYWTDPNKLQMQVNFLDSNQDYVMSYHKVKISSINENDNYTYKKPKSDTLFLNDIIKYHYIPTCSLMYRSNVFKDGYPEWLTKSISGDIPIEILLSSKGKTKYLDVEMACYRRHEGGISQSPIQIANMRNGYIFMYTKLLMELGLMKGYYLIYVIARLYAGKVKNILKNKLDLK